MQPLIQAQQISESKVSSKINDTQQKSHQRRKSKTPDNTPDHKVLTTSESRESNHYIKNKTMQSPTSRGRVIFSFLFLEYEGFIINSIVFRTQTDSLHPGQKSTPN